MIAVLTTSSAMLARMGAENKWILYVKLRRSSSGEGESPGILFVFSLLQKPIEIVKPKIFAFMFCKGAIATSKSSSCTNPGACHLQDLQA